MKFLPEHCGSCSPAGCPAHGSRHKFLSATFAQIFYTGNTYTYTYIYCFYEYLLPDSCQFCYLFFLSLLPELLFFPFLSSRLCFPTPLPPRPPPPPSPRDQTHCKPPPATRHRVQREPILLHCYYYIPMYMSVTGCSIPKIRTRV